MAFTLKITEKEDYSPGEEIILTTSPIKVLEYQPRISPDGSDIEETVRLDFYSSTQATNITNLQKLNRLLDKAINYGRNMIGPRVHILFDPGVTGTAYRSMLKAGTIEVDPRFLGAEYMPTKHLVVTLKWRREPFWEGALTALPLSTSQAEYVTTGVTIYNAYTSTNGNYTDIFSDVAGDLPSPAKIQIENTKNGSDETKEFFIWNNDGIYYGNFNPLLEAEDATGATVTDHADATASGGNYSTLAWTATTETLIATWDLTAANLTYAFGKRYAILARWFGAFPYTNAYIRFKLTTTNDNVIWTGNLSLISSTRELAMLDVLRLPHHKFITGEDIQALKLKMYGFRNAAGTHSIDLDYLQLSPIARESGWLRLLSADKGIPYQDQFIYDGTNGEVYHRINSSGRYLTEFTVYGGPLMLTPNADFRIYYNTCNEAGAALIDQTFTVKMWYRARRHVV